MNKILNVMEDIKQNITDNEYKIIMESLMEIKNENEREKEKDERVTRKYYTQKEFNEMTKIMVKLTINQFFEYTDNENDTIWIDSIKRLVESNLEKHKIGFSGNTFEDYLFEILKENKTIEHNQIIKKIKFRK